MYKVFDGVWTAKGFYLGLVDLLNFLGEVDKAKKYINIARNQDTSCISYRKKIQYKFEKAK